MLGVFCVRGLRRWRPALTRSMAASAAAGTAAAEAGAGCAKCTDGAAPSGRGEAGLAPPGVRLGRNVESPLFEEKALYALPAAATAPPPAALATTIDVMSPEYSPALPVPSTLSLDERVSLCASVAEEIVQLPELRALLAAKAHPVCYDGFEPSGRMHIAQGVYKAMLVNRLTRAGCVFVFWVADWFAMLNNKMGGDLAKIRDVGKYFVEVWRALGMDMRNVRFLCASEEIPKRAAGYWERVMDVARLNTITRVKRCCQIMGRAEGDAQPAAHILYPCMQCADVFFLRADICQLGLDQRKVNMLAREFAAAKKMKHLPVILSHRMMPGLLPGQAKMSKSNPDSAIFMEDTAIEVNRKIKLAFCPPNELTDNPCVAYVEMLVFPRFGEMLIERKPANGGDTVYTSVEEFREAYKNGAIHPGDLKPALAKQINKILQPVRDHFNTDPAAKALLARVKKYTADLAKQAAKAEAAAAKAGPAPAAAHDSSP